MKKNMVFLALLIFTVSQVYSQNSKVTGLPLIGEKAPSFTAQSTKGTINFPKDFGDNWKILFAHPRDFTPVCSSELLELAQQQDDYKKLGVSILVLSVDSVSQHQHWINALNEITYKGKKPVEIDFPLIDDSNYHVSNKYGMIHSSVSNAQNIRAVFIIDPENKIRSISFYPMEMGRNMDEIKRTVIALQEIDANENHMAPANWEPGGELIVPYLSVAEKEKLGTPESDIRQVSWFLNFRKR